MSRKRLPDVELVRQAAAARWSEILSHLGRVDLAILDGKHHPCPKCGGDDRFRMIDSKVGALLCNQCFSTKNGDGFAALQWLSGWDFKEALTQLAEYLGVKVENKKSADPAKDLEWLDWSDELVANWCRTKPPIKPEAVKLAGGRLAKYYKQHIVIALPIYSQAGKVCGGVLYNASGGTLPKFNKGGETEWVKVKVTWGSKPGLMGTVSRLSDKQEVISKKVAWKTEGPTDMLSTLSLNPDAHVFCNANGAGEKPGWMAEFFKGYDVVNVVHDCDRPGQEGAGRWVQGIAKHVETVRNVILPFPITENNGKDLRDYFNDGNTFEDLDTLAQSAPTADSIHVEIEEKPGDPTRLARINLEIYSRGSGKTIKYWRDEFYKWTGRHYKLIKPGDLHAKLWGAAREEFVRLHKSEIGTKDEKPVQVVNNSLVNNMIKATASLTIISADMEQGSWIDDREQKNWVSLDNGILDLDGFLDGTNPDPMRPHDPRWFALSSRPYAFDPDAECPKWNDYLFKTMEGDVERIDLMQEWAGYLLLNNTTFHRFLIMEGDGQNGKSVFCSGIRGILGDDSCSAVSLELFGERFAKTQTIGKLVNICADVAELDRVCEGAIKEFTSGDTVFFDRKGLPGMDRHPTARLMIGCNTRPRFSDKSGGIWRRILIVPFNRKVPPSERIRGMDHERWWKAAGELPGMFNWAVRGLHRLYANDEFTLPAICAQELEDYRLENNPAREFLQINYKENSQSSVSTQDIYEDYREWCRQNGNKHVMNKRSFGKEVYRFFPEIKKRRLGNSAERFYAYNGIVKLENSEF